MNNSMYIDRNIAVIKRTLDIIIALCGIILTLPVCLIIAIMIKASSKGPILYSQRRVGVILPDKTTFFNMLKFRTMRQGAESNTGAVWAAANDDRTTLVGKFLRKVRLDEIPQFINVLKGEMSIIGPRPERPEIVKQLEKDIPFYLERTYGVTPGITGLAQVYQGYDRTLDDVRAKIAYDFAYSLSLERQTQVARAQMQTCLGASVYLNLQLDMYARWIRRHRPSFVAATDRRR